MANNPVIPVLCLTALCAASRLCVFAEEPSPQKNAGPKRVWASLPPHLAVLEKNGIQPTADSIQQYLVSLHPDTTSRRRLAHWIEQLGDADYQRREQAMKNLQKSPPAVDLLQAAVRHSDREIGWRAKYLLEHAERRFAEVLYAVFKTVHQRQIKGLCQPVLATIPFCRQEYLVLENRRAVEATVVKHDTTLLKKHLQATEPLVRIAALEGLAALDITPSGDSETAVLLNNRLTDSSNHVRVWAARMLADRGCRDALPVLVELLAAPQLKVRVEAASVLRAATGRNFGFAPYDVLERRAPAEKQWRRWLADEGQQAQLLFPLGRKQVELGRTLVCNYSENKVYEFDASGKVIWECAVGPQPWSCQGLPNGRRIVASYNDKSVTEYDSAGKPIWKKTGLPGGPTSVQRLENGNTLLACTDSKRLVEIDSSGKTVIEITLEGRPCDAQRLPNGRTLVCLQNAHRVVEVDAKGKIVWELPRLSNPFSAERLDNGNTLVCCMGAGKVVELDRHGKQVWSKTGLRNPYDAQRLRNGNTLIVDTSGITEVNPAGKVVWQKQRNGFSRICRY